MMFTRALPLAMLVSVSATGCMGLFGPARTPMPANEVAALTTCKTGDLSKIKKNLVLAGYGVTRSDYSGLWHADDPDDAQWLYELWDYRVEPALGDAGFIVETSSHAGMTWIYRPTSEGGE